VSATLPDVVALRRIATVTELPATLEKVSNPGIERQLMPGEACCAVWGLDRGGCYCGTVLGAGLIAESLGRREAAQRSKKAAKLRKEGWSAAKIEAWLGQKEQAREGGRAHGRADPGEAQKWLRLAELVTLGAKAEYLGLLLHFYRRDVSTESFDLRFEDVTLSELDEPRLRRFEEDVLYRVRP
jgi:hypothetical protein